MAQRLGYPMLVFKLGIIMHIAPRFLRTYKYTLGYVLPRNGIIAGCSQSTAHARLVYMRYVTKFTCTLRMGGSRQDLLKMMLGNRGWGQDLWLKKKYGRLPVYWVREYVR